MKVKNRPGRGRARLLSIVLSVFLLLTLLPVAGMRVNAEGELTVSINGTTAETEYEGYRLLTSTTGDDGAVTYSLNDKYKDIVLQAASNVSAPGNTVDTLEQLLTFLNTQWLPQLDCARRRDNPFVCGQGICRCQTSGARSHLPGWKK